MDRRYRNLHHPTLHTTNTATGSEVNVGLAPTNIPNNAQSERARTVLHSPVPRSQRPWPGPCMQRYQMYLRKWSAGFDLLRLPADCPRLPSLCASHTPPPQTEQSCLVSPHAVIHTQPRYLIRGTCKQACLALELPEGLYRCCLWRCRESSPRENVLKHGMHCSAATSPRHAVEVPGPRVGCWLRTPFYEVRMRLVPRTVSSE